MKTFEEIIEGNKLNISDFEKFRKEQLYLLKKRVNKGLAFGLSIISISVLCSILFYNGWFIIGGVIIGIISFFIIRGNTLVKLQNAFKERVIKSLIEEINDSFEYFPHEHISKEDFKESQFIKFWSFFRGEDLFRGSFNGIDLEFSELHITRKSDKTTVTVFKGPFFKIRSENKFYGRTVVIPDRTEKILGKIGRAFQMMNFSRDRLLKIDNETFENEFAVFSDQEKEAKIILDQNLIEFLLSLKTDAKHVYFGFSKENIYLGIYNSRDLYKVNIKDEVTEQKLQSIYLELMQNLNLSHAVYNLVQMAQKDVPDPENRFLNTNF